MTTEATEATDICVSTLINASREVLIGKHTLKVRQLKLKEIFAYFPEKIRKLKIKNALEVASEMSDERADSFLLKFSNNLPNDLELLGMIDEAIASMDGIISIFYMANRDFDETITEAKIKDMIDANKLDELTSTIKWILGTKEEEEKEDNKKKQEKK